MSYLQTQDIHLTLMSDVNFDHLAKVLSSFSSIPQFPLQRISILLKDI